MSSSSSLSLSALFQRALLSASSSSQLPTVDPESQSALRSALTDLSLLVSRIKALSLFSDNETVDDLATKDAIYLLVEFVWGEVVGRVSAVEREDRMTYLKEAERHLRNFVQSVKDYDLIPAEEVNLFSSRATSDPQARRAVKIQQFKSEQALRTLISSLLPASAPHSTDFELFSVPLTLPGTYSEGVSRRLSFALLRLAYMQAQAQLKSIGDELELLRSAPPEPPRPSGNGGPVNDQDETWRLDQIRQSLVDHNGPLLDPQGRPLRPFTILPSGSSSASGAADRQRLAAQVFRPDHRLPTMSIDEYLAEEQRRGNIITGGGAASQDAPTSSEILQRDTEDDGTAFAEEREEEKRRKDEEWAVWTESNPKGAGNRGNKG